MKETCPGKVQRSGAIPIEIEASRKDTYRILLDRIIKKCKIPPEQRKNTSLFKLNGSKILDERLTVCGREKEWNLGNYLQVIKKSPSSLKLGVATLGGHASVSKLSSDRRDKITEESKCATQV